MIKQSGFALRGRNPDVLTCIANLSNDEVFTPPDLANSVLDKIADAWATDHHGASLWADRSAKFLDPCTKSGVFLREITRRLMHGLSAEIPDLRQRANHILTKQVFGIGITQLTGLLARRSVYCSKSANGAHSIASNFGDSAGNVWFERIEHTWEGTKCRYCGAPRAIFDRGARFENHAYAFIHTDQVKQLASELFGGTMQFDVIVGNPPYQMTGGAGGTSDSSIYHLFVEQAKRLEPRFLSMVIPARWMAGGRGLDEFRRSILGDRRMREIVDYPSSTDVFPGVEIKAGVCYFLWDSGFEGDCKVTTIRGDQVQGPISRKLDEYDVFVRDARAVSILHKVLGRREPSINSILSRDTAFGLASNFEDYRETARDGFIPLYLIRRMKRSIGYVKRDLITKSVNLIDSWKVLVPEAYNGGDGLPHQILGKPVVAPSPSVCTQSYLCFYVDSQKSAKSLQSYYTTRLFRFLVSQRKITQHALHSTYSWVPMQEWDKVWSDDLLYVKYGISKREQQYIESQVKEMALDGNEDD